MNSSIERGCLPSNGTIVSRRSLNALLPVIACLVAAVPPVVAFWFISNFGVDGMVLDDFSVIDVLRKICNGSWPIQKIAAIHNEHACLLGYALLAALGKLTAFNSLAQMYLSWALICGQLVVIHLAAKRWLQPGDHLLMVSAASALLFSLTQYEVFLYGIVSLNSLCLLLCMGALYCMQSGDLRASKTWISVSSLAFAATFAGSAVAILVWPICTIQALLRMRCQSAPSESKWWRIWIATGAFAASLYAAGIFAQAESTHDLRLTATYFPNHAVDTLQFFSVLFGASFSPEILGGTLCGAIVLIAYAVFFGLTAIQAIQRRYLSNAELFGGALLLLQMGAFVLITMGRAGSGEVIQATAPRYAQFGALGLCGFIFVLLMPKIPGWSRRAVAVGIGCVAAFVFLSGLPRGINNATVVRNQRLYAAYLLKTDRDQPQGVLKAVHPTVAMKPITSEFLKINRLNVFAPTEVKFTDDNIALPMRFSVDTITVDGSPSPITSVPVRRGQYLDVVGWAVAADGLKPFRDLQLKINGTRRPICYGLARPDVQRELKTKYDRCGFRFGLIVPDLKPGTYSISLEGVRSHRRFVADDAITLEVGKN